MVQLLETSLLSTLLACTGATFEPASQAGELSSGLSQRPDNLRCVAGPAAQLPQQLSQLGCFDDADVSKPGPGLVPYDVNAPLWSDDADKQRWFAIPNTEQVRIDDSGHLVLPKGSVLLKTFSRAGVRLETRVWMNHPDAGWLGYSYRWALDGSDASLAAEIGEQIPDGSSAELWTIPGRGQCRQCHQAAQSPSLGLEVAQLDREFFYPSSGRSGNQLVTLATVGLLAPEASSGAAHAKLVDYRDASQALESRARAYLHANCSSCHTSAAGSCSGDFRASTSFAQMGVCDATPTAVDASWGWLAGTKLLVPGEPERSALWLRLSAPGNTAMAMPPLGRH